MVGWKGKDVAKEGAVEFSCLLNCWKVSLTLSMMLFILSGGVHFVWRWR